MRVIAERGTACPDGTPLPHDQCPMAQSLKEGRPIRGAEAIAERPDGTRRWFTPYPTPLYDSTFTYGVGDQPNQPAVTITSFAARQYTKYCMY